MLVNRLMIFFAKRKQCLLSRCNSSSEIVIPLLNYQPEKSWLESAKAPILSSSLYHTSTVASFPGIWKTIPASAGVPARRVKLKASDRFNDSDRDAPPVQPKLKLPDVCCGCGIRLQQRNPELPGFFVIPARLLDPPEPEQPERLKAIYEDDTLDEYQKAKLSVSTIIRRQEKEAKEAVADSDDESEGDEAAAVLCQRCYVLKNHGRTANPEADKLIPQFEFEKKISMKIFRQKDRKAIVLCVIDALDFEGSFPIGAIRSLYPPGSLENLRPDSLNFKLFIAINKVDLLPRNALTGSLNGTLAAWVRRRLDEAKLPRPEKMFLVSARNMSGIQDMLKAIRQELMLRSDLWVVGAQNAGKSSIISALKKIAGTSGIREPTIAPLPGTTVGLVKVAGVPLGPKQRLFDTPGVVNPQQITAYLGVRDVSKVLSSKPVLPHTYRIKVGYSILAGSLVRIDVLDARSLSLYVTTFTSPSINYYMGRTEGVEEKYERFRGYYLTPPMTREAAEALPPLVPHDLTIRGDTWEHSSVDISVAGMGWFAVGVKGMAQIRLWTLPNVGVTQREVLVKDFAKIFDKPGFARIPHGVTLVKIADEREYREAEEILIAEEQGLIEPDNTPIKPFVWSEEWEEEVKRLEREQEEERKKGGRKKRAR